MIPVSAKTGFGIDDLLEMILLVSEMADFKADSTRKAV
jgi:translation initiation factor IF-2